MAPPTKRARMEVEQTEKDPTNSKLENSNLLEPSIRSVVISLMFISGDDECPISENEDLVVNILKNELILIFQDAIATQDKKPSSITLEHILPVLKSQKGIISRFLKYLNNRVEMSSFMKAKSFYDGKAQNYCGQEIDSDEEDYRKNDGTLEGGVEQMEEIGDVSGVEGDYLKKKRRKATTVSAEEALLADFKKSFSLAKMSWKEFEEVEDEAYKKQMEALQIVIQDMTGDEYNRYAMARRNSFQSSSKVLTAFHCLNLKLDSKKRMHSTPSNNRNLLFSWLGNPPIRGECTNVFIAFLAKEIVSGIVGSALLERRKVNPAEGGALKHCYYEEFLRKNKRFRKYGRILI